MVSLIRLAGDYFPVNLEKSLEYIFGEFSMFRFFLGELFLVPLGESSGPIAGELFLVTLAGCLGKFGDSTAHILSIEFFGLISANRTLLLDANLYFHRDEFKKGEGSSDGKFVYPRNITASTIF